MTTFEMPVVATLIVHKLSELSKRVNKEPAACLCNI